MVRKIASFIVLTCIAGLLGASPAAADDARLYTVLTGAAERPGPGDPDGFGLAAIIIDDDTNELCLSMVFFNVTLPTTGLHIHLAPPNAPGPVVVPFTAPTRNVVHECVTVANEALLDDIAANPGRYYLNLHTQPLYAAGAIRGQLAGG
jgi:hypothetical protein